MKNHNIFLIIIGLVVITGIGITLTSNTLHTGDTGSAMEKDPHQSPFATTFAAPVPKSVEFAGNLIKLDRYDLRERFDREINSFIYYHSTTLLMIKRANRYFPVIEPILKKYNIPDDFKYLAVIESHLDVRATSPARATGMWQFMEDTGKRYGLEINAQIDERYHVEKSTEAACKYFKEALNKYGDWTTVAASYNAGMGRISSELSQQQVDTSLDLLLVEETSRYVFRIFAVKQIFEHPSWYGFQLTKENLYPVIPAKKIEIAESSDDLTALAKKYSLTYAQLKDFNPWLRDRKLTITANKSYTLSIPAKSALYYDPEDTKVHDPRWIAD